MTTNVIDPAIFGELQEAAGAEFVTELVDTFLEEAPGMLADLRAARAAGDAEAYRRAAHSLKSNSMTFGATALAALARSAELGGLNADAALDQAAVEGLQRAYEEAAAALKAMPRG